MSSIYKIRSIERIHDGKVFSVGDTIVTIYNTPAIKPMVVQSIEQDDKASGGLKLMGNGTMTSIMIAKHVE